VLDKLSFQQKRRVEQKGIVSLSSLDLAALLRVLDQNWYKISMKMNLSSEARHFVKEMQTSEGNMLFLDISIFLEKGQKFNLHSRTLIYTASA